MLPKPTNAVEKAHQEEFYKIQVKKAWDFIDVDSKGYIDKCEVSNLLKYIFQFPSKAHVQDWIIV